MPNSSSSPLSYQTTAPEIPDTSYEAYKRAIGADGLTYQGMPFNRAGIALWAHSAGKPSYDAWQSALMNTYNSQLSQYNTWLSTGEGIRKSAESGGYNPSYFDGGAASASPVDFQQGTESSGFSEMAQGISGIFQFASALQGLKMVSAQIAGQELKNKAQEITNRYLDTTLQYKRDSLGYQTDRRQFELESMFYPRWSKHPELWKGGAFSPYGRQTYDLREADNSLEYQRAVADLDYLKAGKTLRDSQSALLDASKREKEWYIDNVLEIQKEILEHQRDILRGEYDFQKTEQRLRKAGVIAGIGVNVINAAVNAIRTFTPAGLLGASGSPGSLSGKSWPIPLSYPDNGGLDFSGFGSYSPYE